jgi:hypothetical protein
MTKKEFEVALRAFVGLRPFKPFLIEFLSGDRLLVTHPEALDSQAGFYVHTRKDQGNRVFTCGGVCQLLHAHKQASP